MDWRHKILEPSYTEFVIHWNGFGVLESLPSIAPRPSPILSNLTLSSCLLQDLGSEPKIVNMITYKVDVANVPVVVVGVAKEDDPALSMDQRI